MKDKLSIYMRSGYPGLYIVGFEEQRIEADFTRICADHSFHLNTWSITQGVVEYNGDQVTQKGAAHPLEMLDVFDQLPEKSVLLAKDYHMFLSDQDPNPMIVRKLKDVLVNAKGANRVFVVCGCQIKLPRELEKEITVVEYKLPTKEELRPVLNGIAESAGIHLNGNTDPILDAASGLTYQEAENAFALSVTETKGDGNDAEISPVIVAREKALTVKKNGILEIVETREGLDSIGGLDLLKEWITKRKHSFSRKAKEYGLPVAKGCLTVGIPGCGKSLTAKATAQILGVPLLKLDGGKIFGSLVGESEKNLRVAIQTAEAVAPCVLMVDELEKAFSGTKSSGQTDGGTSSRVFGTFLQWMNDKTSPVFVFATANDITQLPPEFLRKGRFDELWFVDLPDERERREIWEIQIAKHKRKPKDYDLPALAKITDGFTGSEIEAAFVESLFAAFDQDTEPDETHIQQAVANTVPLSKLMASEIEGLRRWAEGRARRATAKQAPKLKPHGRKIG